MEKSQIVVIVLYIISMVVTLSYGFVGRRLTTIDIAHIVADVIQLTIIYGGLFFLVPFVVHAFWG